MSVRVECRCGQHLLVSAVQSGGHLRCPSCGVEHQLPGSSVARRPDRSAAAFETKTANGAFPFSSAAVDDAQARPALSFTDEPASSQTTRILAIGVAVAAVSAVLVFSALKVVEYRSPLPGTPDALAAVTAVADPRSGVDEAEQAPLPQSADPPSAKSEVEEQRRHEESQRQLLEEERRRQEQLARQQELIQEATKHLMSKAPTLLLVAHPLATFLGVEFKRWTPDAKGGGRVTVDVKYEGGILRSVNWLEMHVDVDADGQFVNIEWGRDTGVVPAGTAAAAALAILEEFNK